MELGSSFQPLSVCWTPRDETQPAHQMPPFTLVTCSWDQYRKAWCFADSHVGGLGGRGWGALEMGAELKAEEPDGKGEGVPTGSSNPFCLLVKPPTTEWGQSCREIAIPIPTEPQGGKKLRLWAVGVFMPIDAISHLCSDAERQKPSFLRVPNPPWHSCISRTWGGGGAGAWSLCSCFPTACTSFFDSRALSAEPLAH